MGSPRFFRFSKYTDGSLQWIPKQTVFQGQWWVIVMDSQTDCANWWGFSQSSVIQKILRNWPPVWDKTTDDLTNTPKHTVLSMIGLTSSLWTLSMFPMVTGESYQCIRRTKQTNPWEIGVRHAQCLDADMSSDIRTRSIWNNTISEEDRITKNSRSIDRNTTFGEARETRIWSRWTYDISLRCQEVGRRRVRWWLWFRLTQCL